jgi:hypothetical protein
LYRALFLQGTFKKIRKALLHKNGGINEITVRETNNTPPASNTRLIRKSRRYTMGWPAYKQIVPAPITKAQQSLLFMEKTLGEQRVRTSFNPSDDSIVQHIKERAAEFINYVDDNIKIEEGSFQPSEKERLKALAMTAIEEAAMWAVKAATF